MSGATVGIRGNGAPAWVGSELTQTLDDGSFTFLGVAPGHHDVYVVREDVAPGDSAGASRPDATAAITAGATARVRIVVPAHGGVIRGRVVDGEGAPITDAFVLVGTGDSVRGVRGHWQRRPALTDTEGAFALERLAPGAYTVLAYRRGGGEAMVEGVAVGSAITLSIRPTGSIAGAVKTEGGLVPERVTVSVRDRATGLERGEDFFRTGGQFLIKDLPPGTYDVLASALDSTARAEARVEPGQSVTGLDLVLAPPRRPRQ